MHSSNERGVVSILFIVLVIVLVAAAGLAFYNFERSHTASNVATSTSPTPSATPMPYNATPAPGSDEAGVLTAASAQCNDSGHTNYGATLDYAPQIVGDEAKVGVHCTGYASGQVDILKKLSGTWTIVFTGQEPPSKAIGQQYSLPTSWYQAD